MESRKRIGFSLIAITFVINFFCSLLKADLPIEDNLVMHLDAGTISGVADESVIPIWNDLSEGNNRATQTAASAQPVYVSTSDDYNGLPCVQFDGVDDWMDLNESMVNVGSFTLFLVGKFDRVEGTNMYFISAQGGSGNDRLRIASYNGQIQSRIGNSGDYTLIDHRSDDTHLFVVTSATNAWVDGVYVDGPENTSTLTPDNNGFVLGSYSGSKDFLEGSIAEVILYNQVLSQEQSNTIGLYLADKYNIETDYISPQLFLNPYPENGAVNISPDTVLTWEVEAGVSSPEFDLYLGTESNNLQLISSGQPEMKYYVSEAGLALYGEKIYWRVDIQGSEEPGPVWSFTTYTSPLISLTCDLDSNGIVEFADLGLLASQWLSTAGSVADIKPDGIVDMADFGIVSNEYGKESPLPGNSYVITNGTEQDFYIFDGSTAVSIVYEPDNATVCHIAANLLAEDVERVCGEKPQVYSDIAGLTGNAIIVATYGKSTLIDNLVSEGKLDVSDIAGQWETYMLQVVNNPVPGIDKGLFIIGSDRRATAYGVFDLSEKMGVSPWYWWADVPVRHRDTIVVRSGRYKEGPPSVQYRGIFINDEDWGMHPWAKNTFAPEDGYIGPKTYQQVFELMLRLKANYLWPGMHPCTKAFNDFEENKYIADDYAIVMGSSHCEQMLRNNVWEWYRWEPSDGSNRGSWDWCLNSEQIIEYWDDRVKANAPFENIYTTGMRAIHDSGMPCSGASNYQKMLAIQNEIFPAQRQMLADYVNSDPSQVPQIFCPYKEVLDLYNLGMEVPEDITLVWPDDNHGYIRHLSTSAEQQRSGKAGVYYHLSYWGSPANYLWLCTIPPSLIWEEMRKAYDYQNSKVWIVNVGDLKPAEMDTEFFLDMAWDIDKWSKDNQDEYIEHWAWREFGPKYRKQISEIMLEYYRLGLAKKPEHLISGGIGYTMTNFGDEMQNRINDYAQIESQASAIYNALSDPYKDAFYQLVLYPVRCSSLINQKIYYAEKSRQYAIQGRVSANLYASMSRAAYDQIITETEYYNKTMSNGKWDGMMDWQPQGLSIFGMPETSTVAPVSGSSIGVVVEGQASDIAETFETLPEPFSDDFADGNADGWSPITSQRWEVRTNGTRKEYAINSTNYSNLSGDRLGELSVFNTLSVDNFQMSCLARSTDNFSSNGLADMAIVFGYVDSMNYNYMIFSRNGSDTALHRIVNGSRTTVVGGNYSIPDNDFHNVVIEKTSSKLIVSFDGDQVISVNEAFSSGLIGVGSYNDSAAFTDLSVIPLESNADRLPEFNVFTKQKYFVDIFNKGDVEFHWSATPSSTWIKLENSSGIITDQQRLWVDID